MENRIRRDLPMKTTIAGVVCAFAAAVALAVPTAVTTNEIALDTILDAAPVASNPITLDTTVTASFYGTLDSEFKSVKPGLYIICN